MWIKVPLQCPICHHDNDESPNLPQTVFTVGLHIIEDTEGDATIPYGTRTFTDYDDYRLPTTFKSDHFYCVRSLEQPRQQEMLTKLLNTAFDLALPIYEERKADSRIDNSDERI